MYKSFLVKTFCATALLVASMSSAHALTYVSNTWYSNAGSGFATYTGNRDLVVYLRENTRNQGTRGSCKATVLGKINGKLYYVTEKTHYGVNNNCLMLIPEKDVKKMATYDNLEVRFENENGSRLGTATFKVQFNSY